MNVSDEQLLKWATRFDLPTGISIVRSNLSFAEGNWWIRNQDGTRVLTREGWRLLPEIHDGSLLFTTAREAVEFLLSFDFSEPGHMSLMPRLELMREKDGNSPKDL
jgi:hypothetical protein